MNIVVNDRPRYDSFMRSRCFGCFCSGLYQGETLYLALCPMHTGHQPTILHELVEGDIYKYVRNGVLSHELTLFLGFDPDQPEGGTEQ